MTASPGERLSKFEALRLLCMLMVLNLHSFAGWQQGGGVWQAADFFRESTSICAVDCFILISGYFGIKWKFRSFFHLVFQILFYSVAIYLAVVALGIVEWDTHAFLERFECLFAKSWGFAIAYLILYFCAPVLNVFAEKSSAKELLLYILVIFLAINFISISVEQAGTFALLYLIGRYLRKINIAEKKIPAAGGYWITTTLIFCLVYFLLFKTLHISDALLVNSRPIGFLGYDYAAPLVILQAVFLFLVFARMSFHSKVINWAARSCFAIYLIHMHPTIKDIGYLSFTSGLYSCPVWQHAVALILLMVSVFCLSILIDQVRILLSKGCYALLSLIGKKLPAKWLQLDGIL